MEFLPNLSLQHLQSDKAIHLHSLKGKITLLTFWVSWCPDCAKDLPKKEQLYQSMDQDHIQMIAVNVPARERNPEAAIDFAEQFLTQPCLQDHGRELYDALDCQGVPSTVLVDEAGKIHRKFGDQADWLEIVKALGELMKK